MEDVWLQVCLLLTAIVITLSKQEIPSSFTTNIKIAKLFMTLKIPLLFALQHYSVIL